jgi:hypothetical protein
LKPKPTENNGIIERNIEVNGTHICVKSVFGNKVTLEKALANIAKRKLAVVGKNNSFD